MTVLGVDVGKDDFFCTLIDGDRQASKKFNNTVRGFEQLAAWLRNRGARKVHACLEATGGWSDPIADYLQDRGHLVSIVNPLQIKAFGQSELSRSKTDKADAALIARFCLAMKPEPWNPPTAQEKRLRQLVRRRRALVEARVAERNRLDAPDMDNVRASIVSSLAFLDAEIASLDKQIKETIDGDEDLRGKRSLIESIGGVGPGTSATLLAETPHIESFPTAKALAAFAGVCPQIRQSGTSVSTSRVTRIGNRSIRRVLYMAALAAMRSNPVIQAFAQRLSERHKHKRQIIVAVMHKLVILIFGVLKTKQPFNPQWGLDA